jgi:hypothetical protein
MPRKRRWTVKLRTLAPLTPAEIYVLMTGEWADARIPGWVGAMQLGADETAHLRAAWAAHGQALSAEAASFGFVPFAASRRTPSGPGLARWAESFIRQHRY